ncbi:response regulator [Microbacterium sp. JZ31]|uniref:response regulator n=1 Tax=Microbacterium sp. JZ31 TaxID=1906274 RepID=UPI001932CA64|nr:response regulator [Microbacterium sp. JZ31]
MTAALGVLIVDDDEGARALHRRFVAETPGFFVAGTAATGRSALAQGRGVDLVLLDMRLPDISGIEVLHRLRTLGQDGPDVFVISSSHDQVTVRQALAAHVVGYLVKPFTQEVLQQRLLRYASESRARSEAARELPLAQGEIDRLINTGTLAVPGRIPAAAAAPDAVAAARPRLPKGLAEVTLERVIAALEPVRPLSASDLAAACGISRATARRYLDHLEASGLIALSHSYGKRGRPRVLYRLAAAPPG